MLLLVLAIPSPVMPIKITLKDGEQFWDVGKLFFGSVAAPCLEVTKTDGNLEALG